MNPRSVALKFFGSILDVFYDQPVLKSRLVAKSEKWLLVPMLSFLRQSDLSVSVRKLVILRLTALQIMNLSVSCLYILLVSVGMGLLMVPLPERVVGVEPLVVRSCRERSSSSHSFLIGCGLLFWQFTTVDTESAGISLTSFVDCVAS